MVRCSIVKPPLRAKGRCRTSVRRRGWAAATIIGTLTPPQSLLSATAPLTSKGSLFSVRCSIAKPPLRAKGRWFASRRTGGDGQFGAECSCQCLRRPDFFCMPKRNRGKKTAAGGGLFTRRPPPAPLPPDPSVCPASHLGGVYTTAAPAEASSALHSSDEASNPLSHGFAVPAPLTSKGSLF